MGPNRTAIKDLNKQKFYFDHIQQWKESHLSQVQYCKTHRIPVTNFKYWRNKCQEPKTPIITETTFTPIKIKEQQNPQPITAKGQPPQRLRITLANGLKLSLPMDTDLQRIRPLLQSLGHTL